MSDTEVQKRFRKGELVFTDGAYVFMRAQRMSYKSQPWRCIDPAVRVFRCSSAAEFCAVLSEFFDTRWWTAEHGQQLVAALKTIDIELPHEVAEFMESGGKL